MSRHTEIRSNRIRKKWDDEAPKNDKIVQDKKVNVNILIPSKMESKSTKFDLPPLQKHNIIPSHPFSALFIAPSGSGKTNCLVWLLTTHYQDFFDQIYLFSFTAKSDDLFTHLDIPKKNIISTDIIERIDELYATQQQEVEKNFKKSKKTLVILEDVTANEHLMRSETFLKCFTANRHLNISVIGVCHKLKAVPRTCRLSSNYLFVWALPASEIKQLIEDYCPARVDKKDFEKMIDYSMEKTEENKHPFLFINTRAEVTERFRKGLHETLKLKIN